MFKFITKTIHRYGIQSCERKAKNIVNNLNVNGGLVNIGGGISNRWPKLDCVDTINTDCCSLDFNRHPLQYEDNSVKCIVCEQVIEHLHNTTFFLSELYRILEPNGHLILTTENLASLPNIFALFLQKAPFSTQHLCGQFIGGWRDNKTNGIYMKENHPVFSGVHGHVRVMTTGQLKKLLKNAGFDIINKYGFAGNHYILFHCSK